MSLFLCFSGTHRDETEENADNKQSNALSKNTHSPKKKLKKQKSAKSSVKSKKHNKRKSRKVKHLQNADDVVDSGLDDEDEENDGDKENDIIDKVADANSDVEHVHDATGSDVGKGEIGVSFEVPTKTKGELVSEKPVDETSGDVKADKIIEVTEKTIHSSSKDSGIDQSQE